MVTNASIRHRPTGRRHPRTRGGGEPQAIEAAVRAGLAPHERIVLAVSGGLDSMVLLEAARRVAGDRIVAVASFDHASGAHAAEAVRLVARRGRALGLRVEIGRGTTAATEAEWRTQRWRFLREVAERHEARIATAHTRDDQVETVLMRVLRGAGARGLAGLLVDGDVVRPLLSVSRLAISAYARRHRLTWVDDPTNASLRHLRNRIRHQLLPSMRAVRPEIDAELLAAGEQAVAWRRLVEEHAGTITAEHDSAGPLRVALPELDRYSREALVVLWPALAARVGAVLDRRGTARVAAFTKEGPVGARIQLSGGWEVVRHPGHLELRRRVEIPAAPIRLDGPVRFGRWSFRPVSHAGTDSWVASLPADRPLTVRAWGAGDRITVDGASTPRRVKRYLREAGISRADRPGWPVVLAGTELVWVPGVCRSDAATDRSGRPGVRYVCERNDR